MNELFSMRMLFMNDDIPEPPFSTELKSIKHSRIIQCDTPVYRKCPIINKFTFLDFCNFETI